jgi:ribonuclease HI
MSGQPVLLIHTDGASRGNPGAAAFAYTIARDGHDDIEEADCLGRMTNNQAEYLALIRALEHALELGDGFKVVVNSDSELMVKQVNGEYRVKNPDLRSLYEEARALCDRFRGGVRLVYIPRAENARADALCNEALDGIRVAMPRASTLPGAKPRLAATSKSVPRLREDALACLRRAAEAWAGGVLEPSPDRVWGQLADILTRHGVTLPPGGR